jgi:predicted flap endonuclease-1-like 5' DNA nuclease
MLFTQPEQFIVLAALLLGGWLLGYVSAPSPKKWKRRVREQSESFTAYHDEAEDRLRAAQARAANLTADLEALRADYKEAEQTIAGLRAAAVPPPLAAPTPVETPVEAVAPVPLPPPPEPLGEIAPAAPAAPVPEAAAEPEEALEAPVIAAAEAPTPEPEAPSVPEEEVAPAAVATVAAETHAEVAHVPDPQAENEPHPTVEQSLPMTPAPAIAEPAPIGAATPEIAVTGWLGSPERDELTRIRGIDAPLRTRLAELGVVRFEDLEKLSAEDEMALEQRLALPVGYIAREQWRPQAALLRAGQDAEHKAHFVPAPPVEAVEPAIA